MDRIPRGVEVLVKKASIDPEFRELLLSKRAGAAEAIGLTLTPGETAMLNAVPRDQLEAIIARTSVHPKQRAAFVGSVAAVMIAALGASTFGCGKRDGSDPRDRTDGIRPDRPERTEPTKGITYDRPEGADREVLAESKRPDALRSAEDALASVPEWIGRWLQPEKGPENVFTGSRPDRPFDIGKPSAASQELDAYLDQLQSERPSVTRGLVGDPGGPLDPFRIAPKERPLDQGTEPGTGDESAGDER